MKTLNLLSLVGLVAVASAECPKEEHLVQWGCRCSGGGRVQCQDVRDDRQLKFIMTACEGYELLGFTMKNLCLDWLPVNLFNPINTEEFVLVNSALASLSKPIDGNRLFKGSGIKSFVIDNTEIQDEDLTHISDLEQLNSLIIRNYRGTLFLRNLVQNIQNSQITTLVLENNPELVWSTGALRKFSNLENLYLSGLNLESIDRTELPDQVGAIQNLWLKNNNLKEIPVDFLKGMKSLRSFDISGNKIETLDEQTFAEYSGFISIQGNPFVCDSHLDWLRRRLADKSLKLMSIEPVRCSDGTILNP